MARSILLILLLLISSKYSFAQKKGKRTKKVKTEAQGAATLSDETKAEINHYFLEGEKYYILKDARKALSGFERVLSLDQNNAVAHYKIAQIYSNENNMEKALPHGMLAVKINPKNKYYYLLLTHIQTNLGDLKSAENTYLQMLDEVDGSESYLFDLAAVQLYQRNYEDALKTYERTESHFGQMEQITIQKQQVYLKLNKLDKAINEGRILVDAYPNEPSHAISLAQMMISNDKYEEAQEFIESKLGQYQSSERLYIILSEVYVKKKKYKKAIEVLKIPFASNTLDLNRKIRTMAGYLSMLPNDELNEPLLELAESLVKAHPNSFQALAMTGDLHYNIQNRKKARDYYLQAVEMDGSNFNIWQNLLSIDLELQDYDAVISHANTALEIFPNQASLYYYCGTAHLIKNEYENAIKVFNSGKVYATRDPNLSSSFLGQLGDAYNSVEEHEKSDQAYEDALKAKPDNDHVLNNYSYFLSLRKKDLDRAAKMSGKLVTDFPENSTYLDTHAWVLYMMGDFVGAEKYLKLAVKYEPSATVVEHYGDALFQQGKIDEAVIKWKKARDMSDDTSQLDKKIAEKQLYE